MQRIASYPKVAVTEGGRGVCSQGLLVEQQTFGPLNRDRQASAVPAEFALQLGQARHIMSHPFLGEPPASVIDDTQLVVLTAPVDAS